MAIPRRGGRLHQVLLATVLLFSTFLSFGLALPTFPVGRQLTAKPPDNHGNLTKRDSLSENAAALANEGWSLWTCSMLADAQGMEAVVGQFTKSEEHKGLRQVDSKHWLANISKNFSSNTAASGASPSERIAVESIPAIWQPSGKDEFIRLVQTQTWSVNHDYCLPGFGGREAPATGAFYDLIFNVPEGVMIVADSCSWKSKVAETMSANIAKQKEQSDALRKYDISKSLPAVHAEDNLLWYSWRIACMQYIERSRGFTTRKAKIVLNKPDSPYKELHYCVQHSLKLSAGTIDILAELLRMSDGSNGVVPNYPNSQYWELGSFEMSALLALPEMLTIPKLLTTRKHSLSHRTITSVHIFKATAADEPTIIWNIEAVTDGIKNAATDRYQTWSTRAKQDVPPLIPLDQGQTTPGHVHSGSNAVWPAVVDDLAQPEPVPRYEGLKQQYTNQGAAVAQAGEYGDPMDTAVDSQLHHVTSPQQNSNTVPQDSGAAEDDTMDAFFDTQAYYDQSSQHSTETGHQGSDDEDGDPMDDFFDAKAYYDNSHRSPHV